MIVLYLAAWTVLPLPLAILVGRAIRHGEQQARTDRQGDDQ